MLDLAMFSLAADMAEKSGVGAVCDYWIRVGATYAKRIGTETFVGWPQFNIATGDRRTALTVEGEVRVLTDMAIQDAEGDVIGYIHALTEDPMVPVYNRWIGVMGQAIPPIDQQVVDYYNQNVRPTTVTMLDPCLQTFREESAGMLTVGGSALECFQIAARNRVGMRQIYQPSLEILGLEERHVVGVLRDHMIIYALVESGKIDATNYVRANAFITGKG